MKWPKLSDVKNCRNPVNSEYHIATSISNSTVNSSSLSKIGFLDVVSWVTITHL